MSYVITASMPGYLPTDDDPATCETLADAQLVAADLIERELDFHAEDDQFTAEVIELDPGRTWHVGTDRPHDLGIVIEIHDAE